MRMWRLPKLLLILLSPLAPVAHSQVPACPVAVKAADSRALSEAVSLYRARNYRQAAQQLRRIASRNPQAADPQFWLGMVAVADGFNTTAIRRYFTRCIQLCPDYPNALAHYYMGMIYYTDGRYDDAVAALNRYFDRYHAASSVDTAATGRAILAAYEEASNYLYWSQFLAEAELNKVPFEPRRLSGVSSRRDEMLPFISADGRECFFLRRVPVVRGRTVYARDMEESRWMLFHSVFRDSVFSAGEPLPAPFNSGQAEGGVSLTADGSELYYSVIVPEAGYANSDLFRVRRQDDSWGSPENLGPLINGPRSWESQPSISADGRYLFFASNRKGGLGGIDIWRCRRLDNGDWSRPENLGPAVNTPGNEKAPFIAADGHTLYFLSDGWQGFGGYDIYFTSLSDPHGNRPTNLGLPVNTEADEPSFGVTADGTRAYFSGRLPSSRSSDVLTFDLYPAARPESMLLKRVRVQAGASVRDTLLVLPARRTMTVTLQSPDFLPFLAPSSKLPATVVLSDSVSNLDVHFVAEGQLASTSGAIVDALADWLLSHPRVHIIVECPRSADARAVRDRLLASKLRPDRLSCRGGTDISHPQFRLQ